MPNLRDSCPPPPAGLRTCGSALLFQQSAPGRFSEAYLQCVLVRHRYLKPADLMLAGQCPVLIDCCCPQNALSLGGEDRPVLVDVSSHHGQECKLRGPSDRHPIVAYSECPDFDPDGRRRVPEETKSWNLGVMLCLHPKLIAICKASYNKEGALVLSDDVRSYDKDSVLSVRYLNRIEGDSCADDGFVSCHTGGPDKVLPEQVPPSALFKTKRLRDERELSPIVNVDSLSVGTKNKKRWRTIGADGAPLTKKARLPRKHPVMNSTKVPCLPEGHYLFPYVDRPGEDGRRRFAMVPQERFHDVFEKFLPSCSVSFYHDVLGKFETVSLLCLDVGDDGVSGMDRYLSRFRLFFVSFLSSNAEGASYGVPT
ncbi:hypothetical protein THAOC_18586 [Thalassiosira oceanica]|uniref:Uncharacterized protein n=1 Tax=Thalassiosira oceanica TaxID=159749 RepID=K0SIZ4_THAOC|nr:hypothetical protein THAOC_18586 [Thalassiosira oceanica]|eukprot:EJK60991.1 hypothetical protein THAOC_18586 [Thalassiosira oceanica]